MSFFQWTDVDLLAGGTMNGTITEIDYKYMFAKVSIISGVYIPIHFHCRKNDVEDDGQPWELQYPNVNDLGGAGAFLVGDHVLIMGRRGGSFVDKKGLVIISHAGKGRKCGFYFFLKAEDEENLIEIDSSYSVEFIVFDSKQIPVAVSWEYLEEPRRCWHVYFTYSDQEYDEGLYWVRYNASCNGWNGDWVQYGGEDYAGKFEEDGWYERGDRIGFGYYEDTIGVSEKLWLMIRGYRYTDPDPMGYTLWDIKNGCVVEGMIDIEGNPVTFPICNPPTTAFVPGVSGTNIPVTALPYDIVCSFAPGFSYLWENELEATFEAPDLDGETEDIYGHNETKHSIYNKPGEGAFWELGREITLDSENSSSFFETYFGSKPRILGRKWNKTGTEFGETYVDCGLIRTEKKSFYDRGWDYIKETHVGFILKSTNMPESSNITVGIFQKIYEERYLREYVYVEFSEYDYSFLDDSPVYKTTRKVDSTLSTTGNLYFFEDTSFLLIGENNLCDNMIERRLPWDTEYFKDYEFIWNYASTYFTYDLEPFMFVHPNYNELKSLWDLHGWDLFSVSMNDICSYWTAAWLTPDKGGMRYYHDAWEDWYHVEFYDDTPLLFSGDTGVCDYLFENMEIDVESLEHSYLADTGCFTCDDSLKSTDSGTMYELHNNHRIAIGLEPLIPNGFIAQVCRQFASEMSSGTASYSHDNFDRRFRMIQYAVECAREPNGENINRVASGTPDATLFCFNEWLDSPGHRSNIEYEDFDTMGYGTFGEYHVVIFCNIGKKVRIDREGMEEAGEVLNNTPHVSMKLSDEAIEKMKDQLDLEEGADLPYDILPNWVSTYAGTQTFDMSQHIPIAPDAFRNPSIKFENYRGDKIYEASSNYFQFGGKYRTGEGESEGMSKCLFQYILTQIYSFNSPHTNCEDITEEKLMDGFKVYATADMNLDVTNNPASYSRNVNLEEAIKTMARTMLRGEGGGAAWNNPSSGDGFLTSSFPSIDIEAVVPIAFDIFRWVNALRDKYASGTDDLIEMSYLNQVAQQRAANIYNGIEAPGDGWTEKIAEMKEYFKTASGYYHGIYNIIELTALGPISEQEAYAYWIQDDPSKSNLLGDFNTGGYARVEDVNVFILGLLSWRYIP